MKGQEAVVDAPATNGGGGVYFMGAVTRRLKAGPIAAATLCMCFSSNNVRSGSGSIYFSSDLGRDFSCMPFHRLTTMACLPACLAAWRAAALALHMLHYFAQEFFPAALLSNDAGIGGRLPDLRRDAFVAHTLYIRVCCRWGCWCLLSFCRRVGGVVVLLVFGGVLSVLCRSYNAVYYIRALCAPHTRTAALLFRSVLSVTYVFFCCSGTYFVAYLFINRLRSGVRCRHSIRFPPLVVQTFCGLRRHIGTLLSFIDRAWRRDRIMRT